MTGRVEYVASRSSPIYKDCDNVTVATQLVFTGVEAISGNIEFDFNFGKNKNGDQAITSVSFPALISVTGEVIVRRSRGLTSISVPLLTNATSLDLKSNEALTSFSAPELLFTFDTIDVGNNSALSTVEFPKLGKFVGQATLVGGLLVHNNPKLTKVDAPLLTRCGDVVIGYYISYECAAGATSCYSANIKQADSVSGLTINLPKLDEINKLGIGTVLDPFTLTSAAVETGYITQAVLTDAQTIAAGSVTKIASLAMENLAVVHHILSFDYTQMSSATQFVAATGSLREFAPMTSIVGNEGDGAASLSFVNATSFSSPSVEQAFVYRGQNYCAEESGEWGIYLGRSIQSTDPKFALDICLNLCEEYEWCLAAAATSSGYCEHYTDWNAFVIQGGNTISDKDMEENGITVSGVRYYLGCEKTGSNSCSAERVWGAGSVPYHDSASTWHCYSKWTMLEMMRDNSPDCSHCAKKVSISKNPQLSSVNFLTFESNQLTASNFSSFEMLDNNADLAINVPCSVDPFWSYLCPSCVQKPSTWQNFAEISMCPPSPPPPASCVDDGNCPLPPPPTPAPPPSPPSPPPPSPPPPSPPDRKSVV